MARPLRIEYPGAFYHVHLRGNQKQPIFLSDEDRLFFLKCLGDAHRRFDSIVHVYCLMENHYHLLLETPSGHLSRIMHLINTAYSIYFNKKNGRCGHPFQGRFSSILVQAEAYARELAPYIHSNPVRAGIVDSPEKYAWSNYREYRGFAPSLPWTETSFVLGLFGTDTAAARRKYAEYVLWRMTQKLPNPLDAAKSNGILGKPDFIAWVKDKFLPEDRIWPNREVPHLRRLKTSPDLATILAAAEVAFGRKNKFAKRAAICISHKNTDFTLKDIGGFHKMSVSGVSGICRRIRQEISGNTTLAQAIQEIILRLSL